jgi:hypothetical protein
MAAPPSTGSFDSESAASNVHACTSQQHTPLTLLRFWFFLHLQGYAPLVAWARDMVTSLHRPATLQQHSTDLTQPQQQQQHEAVGMDVVITPGASAALDSLVRVLVDPGDPVLVEEYTYAHMAEAHLLPLG